MMSMMVTYFYWYYTGRPVQQRHCNSNVSMETDALQTSSYEVQEICKYCTYKPIYVIILKVVTHVIIWYQASQLAIFKIIFLQPIGMKNESVEQLNALKSSF